MHNFYIDCLNLRKMFDSVEDWLEFNRVLADFMLSLPYRSTIRLEYLRLKLVLPAELEPDIVEVDIRIHILKYMMFDDSILDGKNFSYTAPAYLVRKLQNINIR
jgi:hypothetical protein